MDVLAAQIIGILIIFVLTTTIGVTPGILVRRKASSWSESATFKYCVSVANSLAAGVFLELCFLGLIPIVQDLFLKTWKALDTQMHYPVGEALVLVGFFLILTVENFAIWLQARGPREKSMGMRTLSAEDVAEELALQSQTLHVTRHSSSEAVPMTDVEATELKDHGNQTPVKQEVNGTQPHSAAGHGHGHSHDAILDGGGSSLRFLMLLAAISLHSLFEGMAIGLQVSIPVLLNLLLAILIHETLVALAIGIKVAQLDVTFWKSLRLICAFTTMIPVGIGLGLALGTAEGAAGFAISGTCQALAAGVFLHVTFMELVPDEIEHSQNAFVSIACMFLGFAGMSLITHYIE